MSPARTRWLVHARMRSSLYTAISAWRTRGSSHRPARGLRGRTSRSVPDPPMRSTPPDPAPDTIWRSPDSVALATRHPSPISPTRWRVGHAGGVEVDLVEVDLAGDVGQRTDLDPGLVQVDEEVGDAPALGHTGVGARQQHPEVGQVGPGGPHLLTGHHPLVPTVGDDPLGPGGQRGQVAAGTGLAEQLAPHLLVAHDGREEAQALLLGPVGEQGRGREVEPERVEPPEVERGQARLDGPGLGRASGRVRRRPPARSARPGPTRPKTGYQSS